MQSIGIQDLFTPANLPVGAQFDLVLVPDVVEHISNVRVFLEELRRFSAPIVLTTPNAFRYSNRLAFRTELINSDHKCWFSPYTLMRTLIQA